MNSSASSVREFLNDFWGSLRRIDRRAMFVLVSVVCIQIISYYYTSKRFFRAELARFFEDDPLVSIYEHVYWFVSEFVSQFILPLILIVVVIRRPLREFGLGLGDARLGVRLALLFWVVLVPFVWVVSADESFQRVYPHAPIVRTQWSLFLLYELCFILYFVGWEFIWRGYMLFGLWEKFGETALLVQMVPFVMLHFGKPILETAGAVVGGVVLGFLALRTGSFWYGVLTHTMIMGTMDLLATLRSRAQVFDLNPFSIVDLFQKGL